MNDEKNPVSSPIDDPDLEQALDELDAPESTAPAADVIVAMAATIQGVRA